MDRRRFLQVSAVGAAAAAAAVALPESVAGATLPAAATGAAVTAPAATGASKITRIAAQTPLAVGDYEDGGSFKALANVHNANYDTVESHYDYASWLFGCWAEGDTVHAVAHHEWHVHTKVADGIPFPIAGFPDNRYTTRGIKWYKSTDLGLSWQQKVPGDARRLYAVPEPYGTRKASVLYGWLQPSANIVKEGSYYYFTVQAYNLPRNGATGTNLRHVSAGFSLLRMSDLDDIDTVEFYNTDKKWEKRAPHGYQGSLSAQQPFIFFELDGYDPYEGKPAGARTRVAQSIRYHLPTNQWLIFGYQGVAPVVCFGRSATLADPQFMENELQAIHLAPGYSNHDYVGDAYMNVFDPGADATDQNMMTIKNNPILVVGFQQKAYRHQRLEITVGTD